jgi:hypothetical protein
MREPSFTLTAGLTAATPRTLAALGQPIIFDYDPVFLEKSASSSARSASSCGAPRTSSSCRVRRCLASRQRRAR